MRTSGSRNISAANTAGNEVQFPLAAPSKRCCPSGPAVPILPFSVPPHPLLSRRLLAFGLWALAVAPALLVLIMMWPMRVPVHHLDAWGFVQQYQHWLEGRLGWREFLAPHYVHPSAVGKAVYFAVLHWLGGNVDLLPLLTWVFSLVITGCIWRLSRPLWAGNQLRGAALTFLASLTLFSASQGEVWVWGFLFQNSIPGVCLVVGLTILSTGNLLGWRIAAAALLCVIATFSFGSGLMVGVLLAVLIWHRMPQKNLAQKALAIGAWLAFVGAVGWFALGVPGTSDESIRAIPADRPLMRLQFLLILLGQMLGKGTVFEPQMLGAWLGGVLLIVFGACGAYIFLRWRDRDLVSAALPWILCALYGLGTATLISIGRSYNSLTNALDERYIAFTLFFVFGTVFLAAAVIWHRETTGTLVQWMKSAAALGIVLFLVAQALNWERGGHAMKLKNKYMKQERAMLAFVDAVTPDAEWMDRRFGRKSAFKLVKFLAESGRLPGMKFAPDNRITHFQRGARLPTQWAQFDKPIRLDDGRWKLGGMGGVSGATAADLILITAEPATAEEQIIALAAPLVTGHVFRATG